MAHGRGGISIAYLFVHLLPELARSQEEWLAARPERALPWLDTHVYLAALLGVILTLALDRATRRGHASRFWH